MALSKEEVFELLENKYQQYNRPGFIENDPILIPHQFTAREDIEIAGLFAATLAWGQRKTIISKGLELMHLFGDAPYDFVMNHSDRDLKSLQYFKHRTFNSTDLLYFVHFLKKVYAGHGTLENIFFPGKDAKNVKMGIERFHQLFISGAYFPARTQKHVASPARNSACKRLNMYLRWMTRNDKMGVDFGIWGKISPGQLVCPCDVHVERVARQLGLIERKQRDWRMAEELTSALKSFDAHDPVKYDFALFGMGVHDAL